MYSRLVVVALVIVYSVFCFVFYTGKVAVIQLPVNRSSTTIDHLRRRAVSLCPVSIDKRRLGNQLFNFASLVRVAKLSGRQVVMPQSQSFRWIDKWFDVDVVYTHGNITELCPCQYIHDQRPLTYDASVLSKVSHYMSSNESFLLCGWFQSWKYTRGVDRFIRRQLTPRPDVVDSVREFLAASRPVRWTAERHFIKVGIHVRVADIRNSASLRFGYTVPRREYFETAMRRAVDEIGKGRNVMFAVASDDVGWCREALNLTSLAADIDGTRDVEVDIMYSTNHDPGFDLIMLSMCDAVIMTTGTYGWWGAWLANKTTYYFSNWPRQNSWLDRNYRHSDFFSKNWIGIHGPYLEF